MILNILDLQPFESFFGINLEPSAEDGDRGRQHDGDRVRIVRVSTDLNMDYVRVVLVSTDLNMDRVRVVCVSTDLNMDYVRVVCVSTI